MKLIMAAFWVNDDDADSAMKMAVAPPIPGIKGSGSAVSFRPDVVDQPAFRPLLRKFDLREAADFEVDR